jgi:hypothetical protein
MPLFWLKYSIIFSTAVRWRHSWFTFSAFAGHAYFEYFIKFRYLFRYFEISRDDISPRWRILRYAAWFVAWYAFCMLNIIEICSLWKWTDFILFHFHISILTRAYNSFPYNTFQFYSVIIMPILIYGSDTTLLSSAHCSEAGSSSNAPNKATHQRMHSRCYAKMPRQPATLPHHCTLSHQRNSRLIFHRSKLATSNATGYRFH